MVDSRIYRAAFAPALIALVVLMFSVDPTPEPVRAPETFAADFDGGRATRVAERIAERAPARPPGSPGDELAADMVASRFAAVEAGQVTEQVFEDRYDGEAVELRNVVLTLPGTSSREIVVVAERDAARGPGAASSAAATGVLLELAAQMGRTRHDKTLVFVSASGGTDGARGMREFGETHASPELIDGVIVINRPGAAEPFPPHVLSSSTGPQSTAAQLTESAALAVREETGRAAGIGGIGGGLARLAMPAGTGAEAVAISQGLDAVGISAAGEQPLDPERDDLESLSRDSVASFGNAVAALALALDGMASGLVHGPAAHVELNGNLIPGWAIALFAATLLLPALATAVDGFARAARRRQSAAASLMWAGSRALPFLAALVTLYLLALVGIAPSPAFPFDPGLYGLGWRAGVVLALLVVVLAAGLAAVRRIEKPRGASIGTLAVATGLVAGLAAAGVWLANPFLALLCVPLAHVWLLAAGEGRRASSGIVALAIALSLLPVAGATLHLAQRLELGAGAPWQLLLLISGGQIGLGQAVLACLLAGALLALALAPRRGSEDATEAPAQASLPTPVRSR